MNNNDTQEPLGWIADAAKVSGRSFIELAEQVGIFYLNVQEGRSVRTPLLSMQKFGALSGQKRLELEALQKAGSEPQALHDALKNALSRFTEEKTARDRAEAAEQVMEGLS